jgi:hypothetical protein
MTAQALYEVTDALRVRLESAVGEGQVYVGPPDGEDVGDRLVSLFLFHIDPNRDLRNTPFIAVSEDPDDPAIEIDAHPVDLRYLISVFRTGGNGGTAEPAELLNLGLIMQTLRAQPTLLGPVVGEQVVRVTHEPYPMEEMSRVWGLYPQTFYRTSVVYLVSPVFIALEPTSSGPPVVERTLVGAVAEPGLDDDDPFASVDSSIGGST